MWKYKAVLTEILNNNNDHPNNNNNLASSDSKLRYWIKYTAYLHAK